MLDFETVSDQLNEIGIMSMNLYPERVDELLKEHNALFDEILSLSIEHNDMYAYTCMRCMYLSELGLDGISKAMNMTIPNPDNDNVIARVLINAGISVKDLDTNLDIYYSIQNLSPAEFMDVPDELKPLLGIDLGEIDLTHNQIETLKDEDTGEIFDVEMCPSIAFGVICERTLKSLASNYGDDALSVFKSALETKIADLVANDEFETVIDLNAKFEFILK